MSATCGQLLDRRALLAGAADGVSDERWHPGQAADGEPRPEKAGYKWVNTGLAGFAKWVHVPDAYAKGPASFRVDPPWHVRAADESARPILDQVADAFDAGPIFRAATDGLGDLVVAPFKALIPTWLPWAAGGLLLLLVLPRLGR